MSALWASYLKVVWSKNGHFTQKYYTTSPHCYSLHNLTYTIIIWYGRNPLCPSSLILKPHYARIVIFCYWVECSSLLHHCRKYKLRLYPLIQCFPNFLQSRTPSEFEKVRVLNCFPHTVCACILFSCSSELRSHSQVRGGKGHQCLDSTFCQCRVLCAQSYPEIWQRLLIEYNFHGSTSMRLSCSDAG